MDSAFARGTPYKTIFNEIAERLLPDDILTSRDAWLRDKLEWHAKSGGVIEQRLKGNRWLFLTERSGRAGETFCLMADVSDLRQRDRAIFQDRFLAKAPQLLEAYSRELLISAWGEEFDEADARVGSASVRLLENLASNKRRQKDLGRLKELKIRLRRLLEFEAVDLSRLDVSACIYDAISDLIEADGAKIEIVAAAGLWNAIGTPGLLVNCVHEILQNALDASMNEDRILVECENIRVDREFAASRPTLRPVDYVRIRVRDSGEGMRPEVLGGATYPFFKGRDCGGSRNSEHDGFGLGLSQVHAALQRIGGYFEIESQDGAGTSVSLYLRRSTDRNLSFTDSMREGG